MRPPFCRSAQPSLASIHWSEPVEEAEKRRLASWCAAVGPVLFRPQAASQIDRGAPGLDGLTFVSWNVHVGAGDVERFVHDLRAGRLPGGRRPEHLILMLQESVRSEGVPLSVPPGASAAAWIGSDKSLERNQVDQLAVTLGMAVFYAPSMRNGLAGDRPADRGNAILSTLPLADPGAIELPGERQRRVAITARIAVDVSGARIPLSIGVAHLDALGPPRTLWVFGAAATRAAQARSLLAALPPGPMIVGADLNSWLGPGEPAARLLLDDFPSTPDVARQPTLTRGLVVDHMFFRLPSGWRAHFERAPTRYGSDHYPLIGWMTPAEHQS